MPGSFSHDPGSKDDDELSEPDLSEMLLPPETQNSADDETDLVCEIPGFFRVLDLITERGSGGLGIEFSFDALLPLQRS
jgi:hypothetical protein